MNRENNIKLQTSPKYFLFLTIGSFLMVVISFSGIFFQYEDISGRLITGFAWSIVTFGWLGQYFRTSKATDKKM